MQQFLLLVTVVSGMGATPTAVANMQAITNMYGPSHKAFLIVPLCGAFFVDLINATVIQLILKSLPKSDQKPHVGLFGSSIVIVYVLPYIKYFKANK